MTALTKVRCQVCQKVILWSDAVGGNPKIGSGYRCPTCPKLEKPVAVQTKPAATTIVPRKVRKPKIKSMAGFLD
jgi:hypothetical protein